MSPSPSQRFATISVPYRALVPERLDGVLAGGRHVASDPPTQSFMREIPQCWMTGQAAGAAAALAAGTGRSQRESTSQSCATSSAGKGSTSSPSAHAAASTS